MKYNENNELNERSISNLIEEKEDENIIRIREALLKKENLMKKKLENETPVNLNLENRQVFIFYEIINRFSKKTLLKFQNLRKILLRKERNLLSIQSFKIENLFTQSKV